MRYFNLFRKKTEKQRNREKESQNGLTLVEFVLFTAGTGIIIGLFTTILITSSSTKAATFDSDLLPDVTNSRNIGTLTGAAKTWKNLFLTGVLGLGAATDAGETGVTTATGGLYFNATGNNLKVYNGTTWQSVGGSQTPWLQNISAAGFTLFGNSTASGVLTLDSTSHATKGNIILNPTSGNVGIGVTTPGARLDVAGGVKIGNDTATCDSTKAGTMRWSGTNFQGCDGSRWIALSTPILTPTLNVEYLVVAGGGGGGFRYGAGGGVGGYRNSTIGETTGGGGAAEAALSVQAGTTYTVTVGGGGAGASAVGSGTNGTNSVFGSITATGGGGGGYDTFAGNNGGSGGGGGGLSPFGAGGTASAPTQGRAGRTGYAATKAGGGGGAGVAPIDKHGGDGLSSSISGSAVTRGGGGGGIDIDLGAGNDGVGGTGGGGGADTSGAVNTGSGGGGARVGPAGNGGSGIVIIRYPNTFNAAASTTGSPTITNVGGYRIYRWTGSGSITF